MERLVAAVLSDLNAAIAPELATLRPSVCPMIESVTNKRPFALSLMSAIGPKRT